MKKAIIILLLFAAITSASAQIFLSDPHPPKYSLKHAVLPASLAFAAGASWGFHETSVNWPDRIPDSWNQQFWDGRISWRNKYKNGATWQPPLKLEPKFWGSTTFLAWTTDSKHLFALTHRWSQLGAGIAIGVGKKRPWWHYGLDVAISAAAYTAGFYVVTEGFKLSSNN
jgi:hypothetical protein